MYRNRLLSLSHGSRFSIAIIFIVFVSILVGALVQLMGYGWVIDGSALNMKNGITAMKVGQIVQTIAIFLLPAIVLAFLFSPTPFTYLGLSKGAMTKTFILTFLLALSISPIIGLLSDLNKLIPMPQWALETEAQAAKITQTFLSVKTIGGLMFNLFLAAILPAFAEEFLFRGLFQRIFSDWTKNDHLAIWISAALFSAIHMQFQGFIPRLFLGGMFGYLYLFSKSLWVPIFAHFVNNAVVVLAFYLYQTDVITQNPETYEGQLVSPWTIFISCLALGLVLYTIRKNEAVPLTPA